jgi:hypothetical protein
VSTVFGHGDTTGTVQAEARRPAARGRANPHSDIDLSRWKDYGDIITDSLWLLGARDKTGPHQGDYHGNFVPQIARQVLRRFTRAGEIVVDLFSGMGTTLIECRHLGRHGLGVELLESVNVAARARVAAAANEFGVTTRILTGDSADPRTLRQVRRFLHSLGSEFAHHVILHPPYWDIIPFSGGQDPADLSGAPSEATFYEGFGRVARHAWQILAPGRMMTLVVGDKYGRGEWIPLGFGCMEVCRGLGFRLKAINVKDIQGNEKAKGKNNNLWRYRALRFGMYVFKHEYVMIFQKPASAR